MFSERPSQISADKQQNVFDVNETGSRVTFWSTRHSNHIFAIHLRPVIERSKFSRFIIKRRPVVKSLTHLLLLQTNFPYLHVSLHFRQENPTPLTLYWPKNTPSLTIPSNSPSSYSSVHSLEPPCPTSPRISRLRVWNLSINPYSFSSTQTLLLWFLSIPGYLNYLNLSKY